jgi:outer membrane protein
VPRSLDLAVAQGQSENPSVTAAEFGVDVAQLQVRVNEGSLYPVVTVTGSVQQSWGQSETILNNMNAAVVGQLTVPIYQGGQEYSLIRQAKETVGQRRLELAQNRDQARANVVQSWGQLDAAKAQIDATRSQVTAAEIALNGVREEARVGQRTTLDVLNATQELLNARVALVTAQRDRVVASYTLLSAVGRLSVPVLGLQVPLYDPMIHYQQVRDAWIGIRTPDGR